MSCGLFYLQRRPVGQFLVVLLMALFSSLILLSVLAPVIIAQAGFTPTPVPPTATNTPVPSLTPTLTPTANSTSSTSTSEAQPLLPQTGGLPWLLLVMLVLAALAAIGMGWARPNYR